MLVLSRKKSEEILIGDVRIKVLRTGGMVVKLGIEAPDGVPIVRGELKPKQPSPDPSTPDEDVVAA